MSVDAATLVARPELLVPPAFMSVPDYWRTLGSEVADMNADAGYVPNPEQRLCLEHQFGYDQRGIFTCFEFCVICDRQNLKTGFLKQSTLGKVFLLKRPLVVWSAHEFDTTAEAFRDLMQIIESHPDFDRRVLKIREGRGSEAIELRGGQRVLFKARTKVKGRGLAGDDCNLDEWFAGLPAHLGSLLPVMSTRRNPQVTYLSSACLSTSVMLAGLVRRGRRGGERRFGYLEWTGERLLGQAEVEDPVTHRVVKTPVYGLPPCELEDCDHALSRPGCVFDDREVIKLANPSAGRDESCPPAISWEFLENERRSLAEMPAGRAEFARERMGAHDHVDDDGEPALDAEQWARLANIDAKAPSAVWIRLTVARDGSRSTIAVAGAGSKGKTLVMVRTQPGTAWVVKRLRKMIDRRTVLGVALNPRTAAGALMAALTKADIAYTEVNSTEDGAATTGFKIAVEDATLEHTGQPALNQAVRDARKRSTGQLDLFELNDPTAPDVSPLVAAAGAWHRWQIDGEYDVGDSYL